MTKLERIDAKIADARKQLDKAVMQRDTAIASLTKAAERGKQAVRALARLEKQRTELRKEEKAARSGAAARRAADGPLPAL